MDSVFNYYCSGKRCFDKLIKTINDNFRFLSVCKMEILWYSLKVQLIQTYRDGQESLAKFKIQLKNKHLPFKSAIKEIFLMIECLLKQVTQLSSKIFHRLQHVFRAAEKHQQLR